MIIDKLSNSYLYTNITERITAALRFLQETDIRSLDTGRHDIDGDNIYALVNDYDTKDRGEAKLEAHRKYIDVQYVAAGEELLGYRTHINEVPSKEYDKEKDFVLFDEEPVFVKLSNEVFAILFPDDLHMPGIMAGMPAKVRKVVIKVKI
jgi:YhcH/YjgK/YiaL family protein